jgi:hypothetical protein
MFQLVEKEQSQQIPQLLPQHCSQLLPIIVFIPI